MPWVNSADGDTGQTYAYTKLTDFDPNTDDATLGG